MTTPRMIGDYELLDELARGGMGVVYRARQRSADRVVAVKALLGGRLAQTRSVERFRREIRVAAGLDHPGIVPIYEVGDEQGVCWFSMKLVEGSDLATRMRESPRSSPEQAARLVESVARAVHHAHLRGVLHRDLKPGNILLDSDERPYVADFGLAKAIGGEIGEEATELTATAAVVGTPSYSSPEQSRGDAELAPCSDVFSLGAVLYELLTGRVAFEGKSSEEIVAAVRERDPAAPRTLVPDLPRDLETICMKSLAKEQRRRYSSAAELADELERFLAGVPIEARPATIVERAWRWCARNRAQAATGLLLVLFALVSSISAPVLLAEREAARGAETRAGAMSRAAEQSSAEVAAKKLEVESLLNEVLLLSDLQRMDEYRREAAALRPARSGLQRGLEAWLEKARPLGGRLARHRAALETLRARAVIADEDERRRRREASPLHQDRARLDSDRRFLSEFLERFPVDAPDRELHEREARAQLERIVRRIERIDREFAKDDWRFESDEDQWWHDTLAGLVSELERFVDPDPFRGAIASIEKRLDFARDVRQLTIGDHDQLWRATVREIADRDASPRHAGLSIAPQEGLVPLGRDPESRLFEFAHLESGELPTRDATGRLQLSPETCIVLVLVPGGELRMGGQPTPTVRPSPNELPRHLVRLEAFFISKFEVTQAQWKRITGQTPSRYAAGTTMNEHEFTWLDPVEQLMWSVARDGLADVGLALPTEAQWEYAARAGTATPWWTGETKESIEGAGNILDRSGLATVTSSVSRGESWLDDGFSSHAPVGSFRANAFGLHDVIGNVFEWCLDEYGSYELPVAPATGERVAAPRGIRVFRGGGWGTIALECRSAQRYINRESYSSNSVGVRPARAISR